MISMVLVWVNGRKESSSGRRLEMRYFCKYCSVIQGKNFPENTFSYVVVRFGKSKQKTPVLKKINPVWNSTFHFLVKKQAGYFLLYLQAREVVFT